MIKADKYLRETLLEILEEGQVDKNPRAKYADGTPAHSKFITQKIFEYNIAKGEFPINTLRTTPLKASFFDIESIYLKQTNIIEEMHPSIKNWWVDFAHKKWVDGFSKKEFNHLGQTYGHTVKRYGLMDKLLKGLEENPFGRRHKMNLWQEQQVIDDPKALEPCAGFTLWSVREEDYVIEGKNGSYRMDIIDFSNNFETETLKKRYIDLTLIQRSQDFCVTASINSAQYCMLAMMVCNHLTFKTGIKHEVGKLLHIVQNVHIYLRHMEAVNEILERRETGKQPKIELVCEPKEFYNHTVEDFKFSGLEGIEKLNNKLEIAI